MVTFQVPTDYNVVHFYCAEHLQKSLNITETVSL